MAVRIIRKRSRYRGGILFIAAIVVFSFLSYRSNEKVLQPIIKKKSGENNIDRVAKQNNTVNDETKKVESLEKVGSSDDDFYKVQGAESDSVDEEEVVKTESDEKKYKPTSYSLDELERVPLPHGVFYYGINSHEIEIPESQKMEYSWNEEQKTYLDDEEIDIVKERERCNRYNYGYDDRKTRRRLFAGIRIANDNILAPKIVGTEGFNMFHTVAYEEFTQLHNLQPRRLRFNETSDDLFQLMQSHGPETKVSIDYYTTNATGKFGQYGLGVENLQFESLTLRWKRNGMRHDDIGIISDADEMFTRDFLRAMQICDVPEFRPGQTCENKIIASTIVFEGSPECVTKDRRWHHPDAVLGECVHHIGNKTLHPPPVREYLKRHSLRAPRHARLGDFSLYKPNPTGDKKGVFPLWHASDIRMEVGGRQIQQVDRGHTGYHFHNIFESSDDIHHKYFTYIHASPLAMTLPLWQVSQDVATGINCTHEDRGSNISFNDIQSFKPIFFLNEEERKNRHEKWVQIVREEESKWKSLENEENDDEEGGDEEGGDEEGNDEGGDDEGGDDEEGGDEGGGEEEGGDEEGGDEEGNDEGGDDEGGDEGGGEEEGGDKEGDEEEGGDKGGS